MAKAGAKAAAGVEVRTLDSLAWRLSTNESETRRRSQSYEDSILSALAVLLKPTPDVRTYLDRFQHVFVDEAQDLVGNRALLIVALLKALDRRSGWTVFLDRAQAIYGWSNETVDGKQGIQFTELLGELGKYRKIELKTMHRTADPKLRRFLDDTRKIVLDGTPDAQLGEMRTQMARRMPNATLTDEELVSLVPKLKEPEKTLILFRRRAEVLRASSYLCDAGIAHRLRIGALPRVAAPWIAIVANEMCDDPGLKTRAALDRVWARKLDGRWASKGWTAEMAWGLLRRIAPDKANTIALDRIAERLAMSVVPDECFIREIGTRGPILGTIHGSKGREAETVLVCVDGNERKYDSVDQAAEEARVLYVAVSRAKEKLDVREISSTRCSYDDGRAYRFTRRGDLQIEVGREGDVDPVWTVTDDAQTVARQQDALATYNGDALKVLVHTDKAHNYTQRLLVDTGDWANAGDYLGALSLNCKQEVWDIVKRTRVGKYSPTYMPMLRWFDVTTVGFSRDNDRVHEMPHPICESRLCLAPVVIGMGFVKKFRERP